MKKKPCLKLTGDLGDYLGDFNKSELICYSGLPKVGKNFVLLEHFKQAILQKKKVVFFSNKMTEDDILRRINKLFVPMVDEEGFYHQPVFDCIDNQNGKCDNRASTVVVLDDGELSHCKRHEPCVKCKGKSYDYKESVYHVPIFRESENIDTIRKYIPDLKILNTYGRVCVYPKYTLKYDDIFKELRALANNNFFADIIIVDYADILQLDDKYISKPDFIWKALSDLAKLTNSLVITVTQANKKAFESYKQVSSEFYPDNEYIDFMCGLFANNEEKQQGVLNFSITKSKNKIYNKTCTVLQDLSAGQVVLDSYTNNSQNIFAPFNKKNLTD